MKYVHVDTFKEVVDAEGGNATVDFINVCSSVEYKEKHIPGVRNVPLDEIEKHLSEFKDKKTIYVHCQSGKRGARAIEKLAGLGVSAELVNVEGGLQAWDGAGYRTASLTTRMPLMRQTMLAAGVLIITGFVLGTYVHSNLLYLSLFIGLGLTFSGLTGWCGLSLLLAKMPWNK